jgi:hypothetical protein
MENKTTYDLWNEGHLTNMGLFQTTLFQAYRIADEGNQKKLRLAFPYWFDPQYNTQKEMGLNLRMYLDGKLCEVIYPSSQRARDEFIKKMENWIQDYDWISLSNGTTYTKTNEYGK